MVHQQITEPASGRATCAARESLEFGHHLVFIRGENGCKSVITDDKEKGL
jgi:hypothetical protein